MKKMFFFAAALIFCGAISANAQSTTAPATKPQPKAATATALKAQAAPAQHTKPVADPQAKQAPTTAPSAKASAAKAPAATAAKAAPQGSEKGTTKSKKAKIWHHKAKSNTDKTTGTSKGAAKAPAAKQ